MSMQAFRQEGGRFFKRNRLLAICGITILSFGMGASAVALTTLWYFSHAKTPGVRPGAYVTIAEESPGAPLQPVSWETVKQVETEMTGVTVGAYGFVGSFTASSGQRTLTMRLASASANLFERFAEPLVAGDGFSRSDEESESAQPPIVLSFRMANEAFGSPAAALGQSVHVNGIPLRVVGVAAPEFQGLFRNDVDAWVPPSLIMLGLPSRGKFSQSWRNVAAFYGIVAAPASGGDHFAAATKQLLRAGRHGNTLGTVAGFSVDPARIALIRAWAGLAVFVAMLLAIVCGFTLGGLLLARAPRLLDEVRLKRTLGAGSARLCRDLVSGPAWIVIFGFFGASAVAGVSIEVLRHQLEGFLPSTALSLPNTLLVLVAQLPLALGVTLGIALVPALRLLSDTGIPRLSYSGRTRQSARFLDSIVVAQIACAMCACVVAVMVGRSAMLLAQQTLGYQTENRTVLVLGTTKPGGISYLTDPRGDTPLQLAFRRVAQRLSDLPGIKGVAVAHLAPLDLSANSLFLSDLGANSERRTVSYNGVTPNYFQVLGTPLIAGRGLSGELIAGDPSEAIINQALSKQFGPGTSPLGKVLRLEHPFGRAFTVTVVGISADQRLGGPKESASPTVFLPLGGNLFQNLPTHLLVNGNVPPFRLQAAANDELSSAFPGLEAVQAYQIEERLRGLQMEEERRVFLAVAGSVGIALIAYIGLYSSLVYFITSKRQELAIRVCCGATPPVVFAIVVGKAARGGIAAVLISGLLWAPMRYLVSSGWIGTASWSTSAAAIVSLLCFSVVVGIAAFPALQASRLEPAKGILNTE